MVSVLARISRPFAVIALLGLLPLNALATEFDSDIRPTLVEHCGACHSDGSAGAVAFLKARSEAEVASRSGIWRSVSIQLRNRTMPPHPLPGPSDSQRRSIAEWIESTVRERACDSGEFAGPVTVRRLNRREYENTVSDLFGVRIDVAELFPVDGSGGEGFDNNGETLFLSPLLAERYLEVAERILDGVVVSPPLVRAFAARDLLPGRAVDHLDSVAFSAEDEFAFAVPVYRGGEYSVAAQILSPQPDEKPGLEVWVDGQRSGSMQFRWSAAEATGSRARLSVAAGMRSFTLRLAPRSPPLRLVGVELQQQASEVPEVTRVAHYRIFGREPGATVISPRREAALLLRRVLRQAYRRPVTEEDIEPYLALFDRAAERGEPFEEGVRMALRAVLVSPEFLFRVETVPEGPGRYALSGPELATRLSYFIWGSMPDEELFQLAASGRLLEEDTLTSQVDRLLDHPRSRFFAETFIGQWLGTKDVGGRVAPTLNEIQHFYTPRIAADMREEPVLLFQRMLAEDRSVLEFITADYTYLTERLAQFIGMPGAVLGNEFQLVSTPDGRRGGLLGLAAMQAMNSEYRRSSPILRGVWVLETILGSKVPPPPPEVRPIESPDDGPGGVSNRELVERHRKAPECASCHDVIDPIGFAFEHYDWLGRWRDADAEGNPIDASFQMPSGEHASGLQGLRDALMARRDQVLRQVVRKLLGYALGRSLLDPDSCAVETILSRSADSGFGGRTLVREVVLSAPFRFTQSDQSGSATGSGEHARVRSAVQ